MYIHACIHTHIQIDTQTQWHTKTHRHKHRHTHRHMHIHTHTHMHIHINLHIVIMYLMSGSAYFLYNDLAADSDESSAFKYGMSFNSIDSISVIFSSQLCTTTLQPGNKKYISFCGTQYRYNHTRCFPCNTQKLHTLRNGILITVNHTQTTSKP